jgi:hypothetical protein
MNSSAPSRSYNSSQPPESTFPYAMSNLAPSSKFTAEQPPSTQPPAMAPIPGNADETSRKRRWLEESPTELLHALQALALLSVSVLSVLLQFFRNWICKRIDTKLQNSGEVVPGLLASNKIAYMFSVSPHSLREIPRVPGSLFVCFRLSPASTSTFVSRTDRVRPCVAAG